MSAQAFVPRTINLPEALRYPASWKEARDRGWSKYFTGKPCKHGHVALRYASTRNCLACEDVRTAARIASGEVAEMSRRYREANISNPEYREKKRVASLKYAKDNPEKPRASTARRRARKRDQACPEANKEYIEDLHALARHVTEVTGTEYHVEHHIPLSALDMYTREDYVIACEKIGWNPDRKLHHEDNLYVMEGKANLSKSYKLPDRPIPSTQDWLDRLPIKLPAKVIDWGNGVKTRIRNWKYDFEITTGDER